MTFGEEDENVQLEDRAHCFHLRAALGCAHGCSDDDPVEQLDGSTSDLDTADLEPDTQRPDVLTITVVVAPSSRTKEAPIEGASVAIDLPGGKRLEAKTDASGQATFHVNSAGPVDVIAAKAGYAIFSSSGLTRTTGQPTEQMVGMAGLGTDSSLAVATGSLPDRLGSSSSRSRCCPVFQGWHLHDARVPGIPLSRPRPGRCHRRSSRS